jgi:hypothetical protein
VRILIQQRRYNLSTTEEYDEDLNLISLRLKPVAIRAVASGTSCSEPDGHEMDQDLISLRLKLVNQIDRVVIPLLVHYCIRCFGPEINLNEIKNWGTEMRRLRRNFLIISNILEKLTIF